jgi:hypothetical protein
MTSSDASAKLHVVPTSGAGELDGEKPPLVPPGRYLLRLSYWETAVIWGRSHKLNIVPTYAIQRCSGLDRAIEQRWALRRRMGDSLSDLFGPPHRPRLMRHRTYQAYCARDRMLAAREEAFARRKLGWPLELCNRFR